jgi:hypothetical protein
MFMLGDAIGDTSRKACFGEDEAREDSHVRISVRNCGPMGLMILHWALHKPAFRHCQLVRISKHASQLLFEITPVIQTIRNLSAKRNGSDQDCAASVKYKAARRTFTP